MPCIGIPAPVAPTLPAPFTIPETINLGISSPGVNLCCKLPPVPIPPIPLPLPGQLFALPGVVAVLLSGLDVIAAFVNQLPLKCPVE